MSEYTLTVLDTSGIQDYLFGTNNLRQNAGASYLADCATRQWVHMMLDTVIGEGAHNVLNLDDIEHPFDETKTIQTEGVQAEVIYAGGGNTAILFKDHMQAKAFTTKLTRKVLLDAPDLKLLIAHHRFDWLGKPLGSKDGVVQLVMDQLQILKQSQPPAQPLRGLGVTVDCVFTTRPAVGYDPQSRPVAAEAWAKYRASDRAGERLLKFLETSIDKKQYCIPSDFEDIGSSHEESSYIAVVHADGNGMGKRIKAIQDAYATVAQNPDYVQAMRAFSLSLQKAAHVALNATIKYLIQHILPNKDADINGHLIYQIGQNAEATNTLELQNEKHTGKRYLPFRPIVYGGDDLTLVCEGRLGLQLAAYYLQRFTEQTLSDGKKAYCRAGVAVTHAHYPFALAYELAESLCKSAKWALTQWQEHPRHRDSGSTAIDWHIAVNGMNEELRETRERDYIGASGNLLMRPLRLSEANLDWRSWAQFERIITTFQNEWLDQRNKLIGLREPLRQGTNAVTHYRHFYSLAPLPVIANYPNTATTGWLEDRCAYFDAIEALDFYGFLRSDVDKLNESEA